MSFEPIKMDLKIKSIVDNSKYDSKNEMTVQSRKVTISDPRGNMKIIISGLLEDHPLQKLNKKSDTNLDASVVLNVGSKFQKRLDEKY